VLSLPVVIHARADTETARVPMSVHGVEARSAYPFVDCTVCPDTFVGRNVQTDEPTLTFSLLRVSFVATDNYPDCLNVFRVLAYPLAHRDCVVLPTVMGHHQPGELYAQY
jgi:hypothetical protein